MKFKAVIANKGKEKGGREPKIIGTIDFGFNLFSKRSVRDTDKVMWYISIGRTKRAKLLDFTC